MKILRSEVDITKIGVKSKKIRHDGKGDVLLAVDDREEKVRSRQTDIAKRVNLEASTHRILVSEFLRYKIKIQKSFCLNILG